MNKKVLRTVMEFTVVAALILSFLQMSTFAAAILPLDNATTQTYKEGQIPGPYSSNLDNAYDSANQLIMVDLLGYAKIIIAAIAILYITILSYKMATSNDEEEAKKMQKGIVYAIVGLVLISLSSDLAEVFNMREKTFFDKPEEMLKRVHIFDTEVEVVITFIKYILAFFAALMITRSGLKLITRGGNEEKVKENRLKIVFSIAGLVLVYVGDIFINKVFYKVDTSSYAGGKLDSGASPAAAVKELVGITNIIVTFIGPIAILMLVVSGIMYITANGEDEKMQKARRMLTATIVGIVIIYGAFALVGTILSGNLDPAAVATGTNQ